MCYIKQENWKFDLNDISDIPPNPDAKPKVVGEQNPKRRRIITGEGAKAHVHEKFERVKTARKRSPQSARWLERQLNDPYVKLAKAEGWRSRAAYKLLELNEAHHFLKKGAIVLDLGVAPGSWAQVAVKKGAARIVGVDLLPVSPIEGVILVEGDFMEESIQAQLLAHLGSKPNLIMSDMAANTVGHKQTDHIRTINLAQMAADFAIEHLDKGGTFIAKVFQGGSEGQMLTRLKQNFKTVKHVKPKASRSDSVELYLLAMGKKS